jgi:dolichol-phosphate mannosyltransferase
MAAMQPFEPAGPAWLVLPTYNEATNVAPIVAAARANLPAGSRILIVDDGSPDGTGEIAEGIAATDPAIEVLHRESKEGLGPAYVAGFRHALARGAGFVMQMDSDFSHDPADLPRLLAAAQTADIAIGSRYVAGGGVTEWSFLRRVVSRGGSFYASLILGLRVRDLTGGFKCFRRAALEGIDLGAVASKGYVFQVEMTYRAVQAGFSVREVPIVFRDRREGESKMSAAIAVEAAWQVPLLRRRLGGIRGRRAAAR